MHRLDDARFCAACGADLTLAGALELVGPPVARLSGRPGWATQASRLDEAATDRSGSAPRRHEPERQRPGPTPRGADQILPGGRGTADVADPEAPARTAGVTGRVRSTEAVPAEPAPAEPLLPRGGAGSAPREGTAATIRSAAAGRGSVQLASRLWSALDEKSRKTMTRLAVELVVLVLVVAAVWTNTLGRSRPAASGNPSATPAGAVATAPGLGIAATDITTVFTLPYAGGFDFLPIGTGTAARLEGTSADGIATIALYGPRSDLTRAVLTIHVTADHEVDPVGRQLMSVFLILYCPGAVDRLQAALSDAISSGRDLAVAASWNGIEARLETRLQPGGAVTVTLLPASPATPTPAPTRSATPAPTTRPSTAAPTPAASPAASQPRTASPAPSPTTRVTPKPS